MKFKSSVYPFFTLPNITTVFFNLHSNFVGTIPVYWF